MPVPSAHDWGDRVEVGWSRGPRWSRPITGRRAAPSTGAWRCGAPSSSKRLIANSIFRRRHRLSRWHRSTELLGEKHGPFRLAVLPIGAYEPRWFMVRQPHEPGEAVQGDAVQRRKAPRPCHWGTFQLTDEGIERPPEALKAALARPACRKSASADAAGAELPDGLASAVMSGGAKPSTSLLTVMASRRMLQEAQANRASCSRRPGARVKPEHDGTLAVYFGCT
jgi:hypothetical protein